MCSFARKGGRRDDLMELNEKIRIAIIPDGNRRWAEKNGLKPWDGHLRGAERLKDLLRFVEIHPDIEVFAVYIFSSLNFNRAKEEVRDLMKIFYKYFRELLKDITNNRGKGTIDFIGDCNRFPKRIVSLFDRLKRMSHGEKKIYFVVNFNPNKMKDPCIDIDLLIRTSGEHRLSGFLPLSVSQAELIFRKEMFPDYTVDMFKEDIDEFNNRSRRFGE